MGFSRSVGMSTGQFLAFNIAFDDFLGAGTNFAMTAAEEKSEKNINCAFYKFAHALSSSVLG